MKLAIGEFRTAGDKAGEGEALIWLGHCFDDIGQPSEALPAYQAAADIFMQLGNESRRATSLIGVAGAYALLGRYEEGIKLLNGDVLPALAHIKDDGTTASALDQLGVIFIDVASYEKAISTLRSSASLADITKVTLFRGTVHANLGYAYLLNKDYKSAQTELLIALGLLDSHPRTLAFVLNSLGRLSQETMDPHLAIDYYGRAIAAAQATGNRRLEAVARYNRAMVRIRIGVLELARSDLMAALFIARNLDLREVEARCAGGLMRLFARQNQPATAIFFGKQSVSHYQDFRLGLKKNNAQSERLFIESRLGTYRTLAELLISAGRLPEAQQIIRFLKQDEVWQVTRGDRGEANVQSASCGVPKPGNQDQQVSYTPRECELAKEYDARADDAATAGRAYYELSAIPQRSAAQEADLQAAYTKVLAINSEFQHALQSIEHELGSARADKLNEVTESQSLMETLAETSEDTVVVYTLVLDTKVRLILITPTIQIARESPISSKALAQLVFSLRQQYSDRHSDPRVDAKKMYDILFAPIAAPIKNSKAKVIMWSLDGVLRYLPIGALYDGSQYLVERYKSTVYTPASRDSLRAGVAPIWRGVGFGISKPTSGFVGLPQVPQELHGVFGSAVPGEPLVPGIYDGTVYLDDEFDKKTFQTSLLKKLTLVHLATHFSLNPGSQDDSFMLMGGGNRFTLRDMRIVPNIFSGADLLTLSACETAVSQDTSDGVEVESFAVLAQRQGAKAVLATLWDVADVSTTRLMLEFYSEKKNGLSKADAMQGAQLSLLHQPKYSHPFFWAPFVLYGNSK
jgi:CHAT domain-containing protein